MCSLLPSIVNLPENWQWKTQVTPHVWVWSVTMEGSGVTCETAQFSGKYPPTITSEPKVIRFFHKRVCLPRPVRDRKKLSTLFRCPDWTGYWILFFMKKSWKRGGLIRITSQHDCRATRLVIMCFSSCDKFAFDARWRLLCVMLSPLCYLCLVWPRFPPCEDNNFELFRSVKTFIWPK